MRRRDWWDQVDRDVTGTLPVFVPTIMGIGLLVSLALLVIEATMRPLRGPIGRRRATRVARRAAFLVASIATSVGAAAPLPPALRRLRSETFYRNTAIFCFGYALYVLVGGTANYLRWSGPFSGVMWMEVVTIVATALALAAGATCWVAWRNYPDPPRWARSVIEHSPFGRY